MEETKENMNVNNGYMNKSKSMDEDMSKIETEKDIVMKCDEVNVAVDYEETSESNEGRCALIRDRQKLKSFLHSHNFQMAVIALVLFDFLIVLIQLLIDIQVIKGVHHHHLAIEILHYISIVILGVFLIEMVVKIYAFRMDFFRHKLEVLDAIVVAISFALDVAYSGNADAWDAAGLLVLLRLWRVVRIVNGIVLSVKIELDEKIHMLKKEKSDLQGQLAHYQNLCKEQEIKISELESKFEES